MKRFLCLCLCLAVLQPAKVSAIGTNSSLKILESVWSKYPEAERFSVYGGMMARPVEDGPGVLDLTEIEELQAVYVLLPAYLGKMAEGASVVHLMSRNIFTAAVVKIPEEGAFLPVFRQWRDQIQRNHWIGGRPERVLLARVEEDFLVMAFGTREMVKCFETRLTDIYKAAEILYSQAVQG